MSELNVKEVVLAQNTNDVVEKLSVNFPVLGKKYGKKVKKIVEIVNGFNKEDISLFENQNEISIDIDDRVLLVKDDLIVNINDIPGQLIASKDGVLVSLNTKISKELLEEGLLGNL